MARITLRFIARHYVETATVNDSANIPVFPLCVEKYSRISSLQKDPYDRLLLANTALTDVWMARKDERKKEGGSRRKVCEPGAAVSPCRPLIRGLYPRSPLR